MLQTPNKRNNNERKTLFFTPLPRIPDAEELFIRTLSTAIAAGLKANFAKEILNPLLAKLQQVISDLHERGMLLSELKDCCVLKIISFGGVFIVLDERP